MEKRLKKIPILIAAVLLASCGGGGQGIKLNTASMPDQVVKNFSIDKFMMSEQKWNFRASRADVYEKRGEIDAANIKMKFYDGGRAASLISSDRAVMNTNTGDVKASGHVVMVSLLRGTTLYADSMRYDSKSARILSDSKIRHEKNDAVITGTGLSASADLSEAEILKDVRVVKKIK